VDVHLVELQSAGAMYELIAHAIVTARSEDLAEPKK
jgi:hypothetical protein